MPANFTAIYERGIQIRGLAEYIYYIQRRWRPGHLENYIHAQTHADIRCNGVGYNTRPVDRGCIETCPIRVRANGLQRSPRCKLPKITRLGRLIVRRA